MVDASALLAFLGRERGFEVVRPWLHRSAISSLNLAEVLVKVSRLGKDPREVHLELLRTGLKPIPFTDADARASAELDASIETKGALSLGDRACLVLGATLKVPVFHAERIWEQLQREGQLDDWELDLRLIR